MSANEKSEEYIKGYEQGVKDFAERAKKYYICFPGIPNSLLIVYYLEQIKKEMTEKRE